MSASEYFMIFAGSLLVGYFFFFVVLRVLPGRLSASHRTQKAEVLAEAKKQADFILGEARSTNNAKNQMLLEELDETLADRQEDLKLTEENLNILESQIQPTTNSVQKLENELKHLENRWHFSSLEKIFIENKIYRHIEECESWEEILTMIDTKIKPFKKLLKREVTMEDIAKLPEIKIKRISKFDSFKADVSKVPTKVIENA